MLHEAHCVHETRQRFRVKIPAAKGDRPFFAQVQKELAHCPLITSVVSNPLTGSVLICHTGELGAIAEYASQNKLFRLVPRRKGGGGVTAATITTYRKVDAEIQKLSGGELDLPDAAFLGFLGTGIYQLARGRFEGPAWHSAFWYAMHVFMKAREKKS